MKAGNIRDVMSRDVQLTNPDQTLREAAALAGGPEVAGGAWARTRKLAFSPGSLEARAGRASSGISNLALIISVPSG
jgi:hypothetical protein